MISILSAIPLAFLKHEGIMAFLDEDAPLKRFRARRNDKGLHAYKRQVSNNRKAKRQRGAIK